MKLHAACLTMLLLAVTAKADTAKILAAKTNISNMESDELRTLLSYFAECADRARQPTSSCMAAKVRYSTEYGANRPIDVAIDELEKLFNVKRIVRQYTPGAGTNGGPGSVEEEEDQLRTAVGEALRRRKVRD